MNMQDINMKKVVEQMAEEGKPMRDLAELFIKEPLSLEVLLMLQGEGPITIEHISNDMTSNVNITDLLDKLKGFNTIDIKDNLVSITNRGQCIVVKLIMNMTRLKDKMPNMTVKKIEEIEIKDLKTKKLTSVKNVLVGAITSNKIIMVYANLKDPEEILKATFIAEILSKHYYSCDAQIQNEEMIWNCKP